MVKLSQTSKLGCLSWSLQAVDTCPGSSDGNGGLVEACRGCYATQGNYRYPNVKAPRLHNRDDWQREGWTDDMVAALDNQRYFRWFDSGDMYAIGLAEKILEVMKRTPWVKHWLPTRMHKFPKFGDIIAQMNSLDNVVVRSSADEVYTDTYEPAQGYVSGIISNPDVATNATVCEAYSREGKCMACRACWDKGIKAIAYPAHGRGMMKVIKIKVSQ